MDLEALGFTKEELQNRVVDKLCEELLTTITYDEESEEISVSSEFRGKLDKAIRSRIDKAINTLAEKYVLPNVDSYIESMTLQQTNKWGERIGAPVTFIEYLTSRADAYMREEVDFEGKTKEEKCGYTFNKRGTRVAYMVDKHLHYSIEQAMKSALSQANSSIANGLAEACKTAINNVAATLKVQATYKS